MWKPSLSPRPLLLALALLAAPPAASAGPAADADALAGDDEIARFCTNIADAARDRRYARQAEELARLQADIDRRMKLLEEKKAEYEAWLGRRNEFAAKAEGGVVEIYTRMKPDGAAPQLAEMQPELAAAILMKIEPRQASLILNEMKAGEAATLTAIMAAAARKTDPS
jgi:flagellar motility protein MotE (MotC chaperone)